jgi:hypothetical protein
VVLVRTRFPLRFRLQFCRVRLDAACEILAERGGRATHRTALPINRRPHRRIAQVSGGCIRSWGRISTADFSREKCISKKACVSARLVVREILRAPPAARPWLKFEPDRGCACCVEQRWRTDDGRLLLCSGCHEGDAPRQKTVKKARLSGVVRGVCRERRFVICATARILWGVR